MTNGQIESLRGGTEPGYQDLFERLLEERKRLLEAAMTAQSVGEIRFRTCVLSAQVADQLKEAIAFAEGAVL